MPLAHRRSGLISQVREVTRARASQSYLGYLTRSCVTRYRPAPTGSAAPRRDASSRATAAASERGAWHAVHRQQAQAASPGQDR